MADSLSKPIASQVSGSAYVSGEDGLQAAGNGNPRKGAGQGGPDEPRWYALKVFYNRVAPLKAEAEAAGWQTFVPMQMVETVRNGNHSYVEKPLISNLLFIYAPLNEVVAFKGRHFSDFLVYSKPGVSEPAPIDDVEMKSFIILTSCSGGSGVEYLGEVLSGFRNGQRVRVTGGIYKGAEGRIKRIKRDRKFLVEVSGVAVVAVSYVPPEFLEAVD